MPPDAAGHARPLPPAGGSSPAPRAPPAAPFSPPPGDRPRWVSRASLPGRSHRASSSSASDGTPSGVSSGSSGGSPVGGTPDSAERRCARAARRRLMRGRGTLDVGAREGEASRRPSTPADLIALPPVPAPVVTFLSDYGHEDEFVGVCHGVIAANVPRGARHRRHARRSPATTCAAGALALRNALPFMPGGDPPGGRRSHRGRPAANSAARRGGPGRPRGAGAGGPRQRPARPGGRGARRSDRGRRHRPLPAPPGTGVGHLPRARHLRAGGRGPGRGSPAGRGGRAAAGRGAAPPGPSAGHLERRRRVCPRARRRPLRQRDPRRHPRSAGRRRAAAGRGARARDRRAALRRPLRGDLRRRRRRRAARSTRTPSAWRALAVNRGSAAEVLRLGRDGELRLRRR